MSKQSRNKRVLKKISLYPLTPEHALSDIFKVDAKKIKEAERKVRKKRAKK